MKTANTPARYRWPVPAIAVMILATLVLTGCAATHVGDAWQCPLAQGAVCTSVAAADPAVPQAPEADARAAPAGTKETNRTCAGGCGPFAWLKSLFAENESGRSAEARTAAFAPEPAPDAAALSEGKNTTLPDGAASAVLRTPETVGRVWIAPFVDGGGVYREASWVHLVIAPSAWRLP